MVVPYRRLLKGRIRKLSKTTGYNLIIVKDTCPECGKGSFVIRYEGQMAGGIFLPHEDNWHIDLLGVIFHLNDGFIESCVDADAFSQIYFAKAMVLWADNPKKPGKKLPIFVLQSSLFSNLETDYLVEIFGPVPSSAKTN